MGTNAAARLRRISANVKDLQRTTVTVAAKRYTDALNDSAAAATGGDRRMSGYGDKAVTLDVQRKPIPGGVRLLPAKRTFGQWVISEAGARPHDVSAKLTKVSGKGATNRRKTRNFFHAYGTTGVGVFSGAKPMKTPFGYRYRLKKPVRSPAKHTWTHGAERGLDAAITAVRDEFHKALS